MEAFGRLFGCAFSKRRPVVIGMIHLSPLPGTPGYGGETLKEIAFQACQEGRIYNKYGLDGLIIENMHDVPYMKGKVGPEIVAAMTRLASEIRDTIDLPLGIQILSGAHKESLAVAHSTGAHFIRVEGYVFAHVADEGLMESCAGELLRYRRNIGAENIMVWTDIKKKHSSHWITSDVSLGETAKAAQFFKSDGLIITGSSTGQPPSPISVQEVREAISDLPIIVGSGVTLKNIKELSVTSSGVIVGSHFKVGGHWYNPINEEAIENFMEAVHDVSTLRR